MRTFSAQQRLIRGFLSLLFVCTLCLPALFGQEPSQKQPEQKHLAAAPSNKPDEPLPAARQPAASASLPTKETARAAVVKLPLYFEPNVGQSDKEVKFVAHGLGYALFLTSTEAVLAGQNKDGSGATMRMKLRGANLSPRVTGIEKLRGVTNYFIGNDPAKWHAGVPTYRKVKYESVYPGVDLLYYGNQQQLEYDFVVAPGGDPRAVMLQLKGAKRIEVNAAGDLVAHAGSGDLVFHKPVVYQPEERSDAAAGKFVDGRFVLKGKGKITFEVASYDRAKPLVIDPTINFSSFAGGNDVDSITAVTFGGSGKIYLGGFTRSTNYPTLNAPQGAYAGPSTACAPTQYFICGGDGTVTQIEPDGSAIDWSTYIGGSDIDLVTSVAVDFSGHIFVAGKTLSSNFPTTPNAFQPACPNCPQTPQQPNGFLSEFSFDGNTLLWSSYIGGKANGGTTINGITLNTAGHVILVGSTQNPSLPTNIGGYQPVFVGTADAHVAEFDTSKSGAGSLLNWTYLGGAGGNTVGTAITYEPMHGYIYVAGSTDTANFQATPGTVQTIFGGDDPCDEFDLMDYDEDCGDAYVAELDSSFAQGRVTYLGGKHADQALAITLDPFGNVWVAGATSSSDFPVTIGSTPLVPLSCLTNGNYCAGSPFVTAFDPMLQTRLYSGVLVGNGSGFVSGAAADSLGNMHFTGVTNSTNFLLVNPLVKTLSGGTPPAACTDFHMRCGGPWATTFSFFSNGYSAPIFSSYLPGGSNDTVPSAIAVNPIDGSVTYVGGTASSDLPTMQSKPGIPLVQGTFGGVVDGNIYNITLYPTACTATWIGGATGIWSNAGGWSTGNVPRELDWACLNGASLTIDSTLLPANQKIANVSDGGGGTLTITGNSLTIGSTAGSVGHLNNLVLNSTATLTVNNNITVAGTFAFSGGTIVTSKALTIQQLTTCTGGSVSGPNNGQSSLIVNGGMNLTGTLALDTVSLLNGGATNMIGPATQITLVNGAFPGNSIPAATWDVQNSAGISQAAGGNSTFTNFGVFTKSGAGTTTLNLVFENEGTLNANSGTLVLSGGANSSTGGLINVAASANLQISGPISLAATNSVAGAGTITWNPNPNAFLASGTYNVTGASNFNNGNMFFTDETVTSLGTTAMNSATVTFSGAAAPAPGTTVMVSNPITMTASILNNNAGSKFTITNDSGILSTGVNTSVFNNADAFTKSNGTTTTGTTISATFNNTGTVQLSAGAILLLNGGNCGAAGKFNLAPGTQLQFNGGNYFVLGAINGAGTGSVTVQGTGGSSASLEFVGPRGTAGLNTLTIGPGGTLQIDAGVTATLASVNMTGGLLTGLGTIVGNITNTAGTLQPGVPPGTGVGTLTVTGNYTQAVGGTFNMAIAGKGAGQFGQLTVSGAANLGGTISATLSYAANLGDKIKPVLSASESGAFAPNNMMAPAGDFWSLAYTSAGVVATLATAGQVALTPSPLPFGNQRVGPPSTALAATLTNNTGFAVTLAASNSVQITGTNASDFSIATGTTCKNGLVVQATSGTCVINIIFTPGASGPRTATLTVTSNASPASVSVTLNGTGTAPIANASPAQLAFGNQAKGVKSSQMMVTVSNTGSDTLHLAAANAVAMSGANASDFAVVVATTTCINGVTVAVNGSCVVELTFTPSTTAGEVATLTITDDSNAVTGSTQTVSLSGTGTNPGLPTATLSTNALAFGNQGVAAPSASQTITITNGGGATLTLAAANAITITGTNASDFTLASGTTCTNGASVAGSGGTCVIIVIFTPGATGARGPATVNITDNANPATQTATLTGTGIDFTLTVPSAAVTVTAGNPAIYTIDVAPGANGYASVISFAASGAPSATTVAFKPPTLTPNGNATSTMLTITTTQNSTALPPAPIGIPSPRILQPILKLRIATLLAVLIAAFFARQNTWARRCKVILPLVLLLASGIVMGGCNNAGQNTPPQGTPVGTYTITVTATSGSLAHTIKLTLTVN